MSTRSASLRSLGPVAALALSLAACSASPAVSGEVGSASPASAPTGAASPVLSPTPSRAAAQGQIVFADEAGASGHAQLYVEHADGTNAHQLIVSNFDDRGPALSRDGRRVAFARYGPEGSTDGGVFVVNIDGTGLVQLDKDGEDVSWSPDGTKLVETHGLFDASGAGAPYNVALWVMNADGSDAHQITLAGLRCPTPSTCTGGAPGEPGAQDNEARFSPDGKRIAFLRDTYTSPEQFSVFTIAVDGSDLRRVTPEGMEVGNPHWSPDGNRILFQSPKEPVQKGEQNIYVINVDGTGLVQLTNHLGADGNGTEGTFHPCWSPDGTQIVFSHYPGSPGDRASLYVMNADGSDIHLLSATTFNQNGAEWGPLPTG